MILKSRVVLGQRLLSKRTTFEKLRSRIVINNPYRTGRPDAKPIKPITRRNSATQGTTLQTIGNGARAR